jgi:hypothetical protein
VLLGVGVVQLMPADPFRSLSIFTIDIHVLYGLAAYGGRPALD